MYFNLKYNYYSYRTLTIKKNILKNPKAGRILNKIHYKKDIDILKRPDEKGRFGKYGGQYVPETLIDALRQLEKEYYKAKSDSNFQV